MLFTKSILSTSTLLLGLSLGAPISIKIGGNTPLGYATSSNLNPGIYRDGGGGACVNGLCIAGFSDTTICNGPFQTSGSDALGQLCKSVGGALGLNSFAHNTFATFSQSYAGLSNQPPSSLNDYGKHDGTNGQLIGPVLDAVTDQERAMGANFAIWPNSNMVPLPAANGANGVGSTDVIGVFNALNTAGTTMYNTMAKITVTDKVADGQTMPATRIVPQLFQQNENLYGTYAVMAGHGDDNLYLFARNSGSGVGPSSIKIARVPQRAITDKTQYQYWDGSTWSSTQPAVSDAKSNVITSQGFMDTGEIFWSNHFNCYVHVTSAYGGFQIQYSDNLTSGWSAPQDLYKAALPSSLQGSEHAMMYGGHAYPDWDTTGKSLLLSWTAAEEWIQMATVQFA